MNRLEGIGALWGDCRRRFIFAAMLLPVFIDIDLHIFSVLDYPIQIEVNVEVHACSVPRQEQAEERFVPTTD